MAFKKDKKAFDEKNQSNEKKANTTSYHFINTRTN